MRFITLFLLITSTQTFSQVFEQTDPIWQDEFDGNVLDLTKWETCPEWKRQGFSYWEADNHEVDNGLLRLDITQKNDSVFCGAVRTKSTFQKKYGYFEVRCKLPEIKGGWAAFWLMPNRNDPGDEGRDGTEIDVFETINGWKGELNHALHWDGYGEEHQGEGKTMERPDMYDDSFHTFGLKWTPNQYTFYVDGIETWRTSAGGISHVPQYMKLTLEVTNAEWAGNWEEQTEKPIHWYVDYVRVYEIESITSIKQPEESIMVFPNPTTGSLRVNHLFEENTQFSLLSLDGRTVLTGTLRDREEEVDLGGVPNGVYTLVINAKNITKKIVINR